MSHTRVLVVLLLVGFGLFRLLLGVVVDGLCQEVGDLDAVVVVASQMAEFGLQEAAILFLLGLGRRLHGEVVLLVYPRGRVGHGADLFLGDPVDQDLGDGRLDGGDVLPFRLRLGNQLVRNRLLRGLALAAC